jgi:hypothetical protein
VAERGREACEGQRADEQPEVAQGDVVEAIVTRLRMIPPSQPATRRAPNRGATATAIPATTSITPTASIAWWAVPGISPSICGAR